MQVALNLWYTLAALGGYVTPERLVSRQIVLLYGLFNRSTITFEKCFKRSPIEKGQEAPYVKTLRRATQKLYLISLLALRSCVQE